MANYKQLKEKSYELIKQEILSNRLESGQYLEEKMLCDMVGASRTPVRESINMLEQERLVQTIPGKGVFVTTVSVQSIKELFQMRRMLEPLALQMAHKNLNIDMLLSFRDKFMVETENKNYASLHQLDYEFHNYINDHSSNEYMIRFLRVLSDNFQRVRTQPFYAEQRTLGGAREHLTLIELIIDGNIENAKNFLVEHITNTEKYYFKSLSSNG